MSEDSRRYPGFWKRALADAVDSVVLDLGAVFLTIVLMGALYWVKVLLHLEPVNSENAQSLFFKDLEANLILFLIVLARGTLSLLYYTWGHYRYGTTFGKILFRIYVVSAKGDQPLSLKQSLIRTLNYLTSYIPFCGGFLLVLFQPQKRAFHDLLANTVCILRSKE